MTMAVMHVRHMGVRMPEWPVFVKMCVRLARRIVNAVLMTMVFVMNMRMSVCQCLMRMFVFVAFGQMQPHADRH